MEVVQKECERLGVTLPPDHEHAYNAEKLHKEEEEYRLATRLLCPSDFVVKTFLDKGYPREQLVRHIYGYDEKMYYPGNEPRDPKRGLTMLFVGVCAVRKGVHYALEAWLKSPASKTALSSSRANSCRRTRKNWHRCSRIRVCKSSGIGTTCRN